MVNWALVVGVLWLASGAIGLASVSRNHSYVKSLPDSPGNRRVRHQHYWMALFGVFAVTVGLWNLVRYFR